MTVSAARLGRCALYAAALAAAFVLWLLLGSEPAEAAEEPRPLTDLTTQLLQGTVTPTVAAATTTVRETTAASRATEPVGRLVRPVLDTADRQVAATSERLVTRVAQTETAVATATAPLREPLQRAAEKTNAQAPAAVAASAQPVAGRAADRAAKPVKDRPRPAAASTTSVADPAGLRDHEQPAGPAAVTTVTLDAVDRAEAAQSQTPAWLTGSTGETLSTSVPGGGAVGAAVLPSAVSPAADRRLPSLPTAGRPALGALGAQPGHTPD